jgi:hypothetical protein
MRNKFINKVQCARTGFIHPANEMRREFDGQYVHYSVVLPRNPQDIYSRSSRAVLPSIIRVEDDDNLAFQQGIVDPNIL